MMERVRCGLIGAGWWGTRAHLPALCGHPEADVVAVQHHDAQISRRVADDFGVPHGFTSADELLALDRLDAVVISSTPHLHHPQAIAALQRGLHVLVEKPMTLTARQAKKIVDLAAENNVELIVGCPFHYTRHAAMAQRLVGDGTLGAIKLIHILMTDELLGFYRGQRWPDIATEHPDPEIQADAYLPPGQNSYSDPRIVGGGQIYCQVAHPAAYVAFLTGDEAESVHALFDRAGTQVDVHNALNIRMTAGTIVFAVKQRCPGRRTARLHGLRVRHARRHHSGFVGRHDTDLRPQRRTRCPSPAE